ncbi:MAG: outer membrane protein transport protein [Acidobacteriia bacterium]|nr:outer membrane protein transport protein [Terriglobia bacterium]
MSTKRIISLLLVALAVLFTGASLWASGFSIFEQGVRANGRAGAFAATADDPSAIYYNPAGIGQLKGTHFTSAANLIYASRLRFHPNPSLPGPTERFFHSNLIVPDRGFDGEITNHIFLPSALYLTQEVTHRVTVGYGLYFPFSLQTNFTNFNDNQPVTFVQNGKVFSYRYPGRFASSRSIINTAMHNPTVGIEINKNIYFGFGVDIAHMDVTLERSFLAPDDPGTLALAGSFAQQLFPQDFSTNPAAAARAVAALLPEGRSRLSGEGTSWGGNAGILIKAPHNTNIAVTYRSPITIHINGTAAFGFAPFTPLTPFIGTALGQLFPNRDNATTVVKLPPTYSLGIQNHSLKNSQIEFDFVAQDYRTIKNVPVNFATQTAALTNQIIPVSNRPSFQYRLGFEHFQSERFTWRLGYYFDFNPLPDKDMGILQPDANRQGPTVGVTFPAPHILIPWKTTVDLSYMGVFFQDRTVGTLTNFLNGTAGRYQGQAHIFSVGFNVVREKAPVAPKHPSANCTIDVTPIQQGKTANVSALVSDFDLNTVTYSWSTTGGKVNGTGSTIVFDSTDTAPGTYTVTAKVTDKAGDEAMCSVNVEVEAPPKVNHNPTVSCSADRTSLIEGESTGVHASASDPDGDPLTYTWSTTAGHISGSGADVTFDSTGVPGGTTATITVVVDDGRGGTATCSVSVQVNPAPPKAKPQPVSCMSEGFPSGSARINNVDKACLDDVSLKMQNDPRASLTITGYSDKSEKGAKALAGKRAEAAKNYLVKEKQLDPSRIETQGAAPIKGANAEERKKNRRIEIVFYPEGTK